MLNRPRLAFGNGMTSVAVLLAWVLVASGTAPTGWYVAGSKPTEYESGVDAGAMHDGRPSAYLKAKKPAIEGFGTLMQDFRADRYVGKRVRFSASVRTDDVQSWAGLWMRVDRISGAAPLAFDNMQDRPIKGTTDWQSYDVVLDVPQGATGIFFGVLLDGSGGVWLSDAKFEAVGPEVPVTGELSQQAAQPPQRPRPDQPTNLDFQN